jgi:tryptophan 2,3-dioxygenase
MRELEILVGLKEDDRLKLNGQVYRQQFQTDKDDFTDVLDARVKQPSLKDALYRVLAHMTIPGRDDYAKLFVARKIAQYEERKKDLKKKEQVFAAGQEKLNAATEERIGKLILEKLNQPQGRDQESASQFLADLGLEYRQQERAKVVLAMPADATDALVAVVTDWVQTDAKMASATVAHLASSVSDVDVEIAQLDEFFYSNEPIDTREPADVMRQKGLTEGVVRRAALSLLSHPWTQGGSDRAKNDFSEWSLLLGTVLKLEQGFLLWRNRHARMVEMMIGRRSGTGGSSGVHYLDKTQLYRYRHHSHILLTPLMSLIVCFVCLGHTMQYLQRFVENSRVAHPFMGGQVISYSCPFFRASHLYISLSTNKKSAIHHHFLVIVTLPSARLVA